MRYFFSTMSVLLLLMSVTILAIQHIPLPDYCGGSPLFNSMLSTTDNIYLDEQTGIILTFQASQNEALLMSPDSHFSLEMRDDELHLNSLNGGTDRLIYGSENISSVHLADNRTVIVQEFDEIGAEHHILSLDIDTGNVNFEYHYPADIRWQALHEQVTPYLYAQFLVNPEDDSQGLMFMDTITGEITRFTEPTAGIYFPSESGRWLASAGRNGISIIDPATGDYHPNFSSAIPGGGFRWQGDDILWFVRGGADNLSLWRATLTDNRVESVIENARLKALSADGGQAYVRDTNSNEMILVNTDTGERQVIDTGGIPVLQFNTPAFSTDGRCIAILLTDFPDMNTHQLWIIDTETAQARLQLNLSGTLNTLEWQNPGE